MEGRIGYATVEGLANKLALTILGVSYGTSYLGVPNTIDILIEVDVFY